MEVLLQQVNKLLKLAKYLINIQLVLPLQGRPAAACSGKLWVATAARAAESGGQSVDDDLAGGGGKGVNLPMEKGHCYWRVGTTCPQQKHFNVYAGQLSRREEISGPEMLFYVVDILSLYMCICIKLI